MLSKFIAITACASLAFGISAQAQRAVHLGIGGGTTLPMGHVSDTYSSGGNVLGSIVWGPEESFLGGRIDYNASTLKGRNVAGKQYRDVSLVSVTGNVVGTFAIGRVKPYAIAGAGWYPFRAATDTHRENQFGANGGIGMAFPFLGTGAFLEARYHDIGHRKSLQHYMPITFGILL